MWIVVSMGLAALSLCLAFWWLAMPYARAGAVAQPAPGRLARLLWPWVEALAPACRPFMSWRSRRRLDTLLQRAGMSSPWSAQHLFAFQVTLALLAGAGTGLATQSSLRPATTLACALAAALVATTWPVQRLREHIQRRRLVISREFPFLLDMVTLCVEAGLNLHGALRQAARNGPGGSLRDELHHMLSDIRAGMARHEALEQWARRCDLPAVHHFVAAVAQADRSGMSLGPVLRAQADQRRNERFLRAEKLALEAPVKMMFPLVFCIFPCSFLIIAFPIASKFLALAQ